MTFTFIRTRVDEVGCQPPPPPHKDFLVFFLNPYLRQLHLKPFDPLWQLTKIGCYGFEIRRHKQLVVKKFLNKNSCFPAFLGERRIECEQNAAKNLRM